MVICKYFQNGNCRFGSKCVNEHMDIKASIKTEVEAALKGSQWPLSCFGPFKEKPNIPNFIEDQSFEEIRYLCYEAKKQNCFPAFHQQYNQMITDAKNKMNALLTLNRDVIEVVTNLYNNSPDTKSTGTKQNSLFGSQKLFSNNTSSSTSGIGQSNPFSTVSGNSIFGTTNNAMNTNTNSMFGGTNNNNNSTFGTGTTNNIFQQSGGNLFSQQSQSSMFGGGGGVGVGNSTGFSTTNQTNLFGQVSQQQQQQPLSGGNLFSQQPSSFGGFGQTTQNQLQQQQVQQQTSIFGNAAQQSVAPSGFGSALFNQQPQQQNQNVFGASQPQQQGLFGQQQQQQQQQQQSGLFSTALTQQQQPVNLSSSAFSNSNQTIQQNTVGTTSLFGGQQQQQPQQQNFGGNLFGQMTQQQTEQQTQQQTTVGGFGGGFNQQQQQQQPNFSGISQITASETIYSKMADLKPEEIEAFKAEIFEIGKIPTNPPPRELIQFTH